MLVPLVPEALENVKPEPTEEEILDDMVDGIVNEDDIVSVVVSSFFGPWEK